jgi:mono/diheme cytochrome c family protein
VHLSELHGAATHLAVVAIPVYVIVLLLRRTRGDHPALGQAEPWLLGAALAGVAAAGVTGLLVWGQAQTMLRGHSFRIGTAHFWLGIGLAVVLAAMAVARWRAGTTLLAGAVVATAVVVLQGYLGGRMTYDQGVGIAAAGQFAQSASGAAGLEAALARGTSEVAAGRKAFSTDGLGCASCHGDRAQGQRGPRLAGGAQLEDFRRKHADGLFPPRIVSDADFRAVDAWLRSLR